MKVSATLVAALGYAKRGWRVFPILALTASGGCECAEGVGCERAGKHPAIKEWNKLASTDPDVIREWWSGLHASRGVGIATGKESGLTVLDVDGDEGVATLGKLAGADGVPATPMVQSRVGRYHYYFQYADGVKSQAGVLGVGLDTRGEGGYVVAPPSRHSSGLVYTWLQGPEKRELAVWPEFLRNGGKAAGAKGKVGRPAKETFNPANPAAVLRLLEALSFVDADDEERWGQVGWILGRAWAQTDVGYAHYAAWAGRSRKFNAKKSREHYYVMSKAVRGGELKTTGSIFSWAKEGGWVETDAALVEERTLHVYETPFRESTMVEDFAKACGGSDGVYVMGTRLVQIVRYGVSQRDGEISRDAQSYVVLEHNVNTLAVELGLVSAYWTRRASGEHERTAFNRASIKTFLDYHRYDGVKPLIAFVPHPVLRADGTLIHKLGYDAASQLYLTAEVPGLKVDDRLTRKAAVAAMKRIMEPFAEYPWAGAADRAVFVAALFTVGMRHLFATAPMFGFSSPVRGSGKTLLTEALSLLWYGVTLSKTQWGPTSEEREKRWSSFLLAGDRLIGIDNVPAGVPVEDATLNTALTSRSSKYRILGKTEKVELNNDATWLITGNQLNIAGDLVRRVLVCYIDPKMKNPGARVFKVANLAGWVIEHRAELMGLALSIASSWIRAGRPLEGAAATREFGSFEGWYGIIRPLLLWAGEADIAEAVQQREDEDEEGADFEYAANVLRARMPADGSGWRMRQLSEALFKDVEFQKSIIGCMPAGAIINNKTLADFLRLIDRKVYVSDNPGEDFTFYKARDRKNKQWILLWKWVK